MTATDPVEGLATIPEFATIAHYVRYYAGLTPDAPATWFEGDVLTYAELDSLVDELARAFLGAGVGIGDRVAVLSTPRPEFLVTLLASMRAGAIWVGLNPRYTYPEFAHVVGDSEPTLLLAISEFEGHELGADIGRLRDESSSLRAAYRLDAGPAVGPLAASGDLLAEARRTPIEELERVTAAVDTADAAVIVYTSGSSGRPKGAVLSHQTLVYGFRTEAVLNGISQPRVPCNLPVNHVACIGDLCSTTLIAGGMIVFLERFDPGEVLERVETLRLTSLLHVPTVLQLLTMHPDFTTRDLSSLRLVAWGGAPLPIDVVRTYRELGVRLTTVYGMTETAASITWTDPDADDETLATTVGRPDPDMDVRLVNEHGEDADDGEDGEVWVRHRCVMKEYFRQPEATAAAFTDDGFFRTGDVAVRLPDGNLRIVGRRTEMFKSGGYNVYPREIELCLEDHPAVALAAVIGVADPIYNEVGAAFVVRTPGHELTIDELRAWCRERLANYKIPKRFEIRDALPLLPIGKVDKRSLKDEAGSG